MTDPRWARSGVMALTGWPDGPPLAPRRDPAGPLDALVDEVARRSGVRLDWADLLAGRAAMLGLRRQGRTSANGTCRLLPAAGGWMALNLARADDVVSVPALVEGPVDEDPWEAAGAAARRQGPALVERARWLGMPAAVLGACAAASPSVVTPRWAATTPGRGMEGKRVVDCSALWAGPLVARILAAAGASVVKVEAVARPDASRATPAFYEWLHPPGQEEVRLDFATTEGRRRLYRLLDGADVVIESSRPRALGHLGAGPGDVGPRPGRTWLSITGYGRNRDWVAFGDDAAVAGGLVAWDADGGPVFCGDAIADPLSGLWGAVEVLRAVDAGGGVLIDVAMAGVAAGLARAGSTPATTGDGASVAAPRWPAPWPS